MLVAGAAVLLDGARGAVLCLTVLVVGWTLAGLFRNHRRNNQNEELMIFITAKVIKL